MDGRCLTCGETIPDGKAHTRGYSERTGWSTCQVVDTPFGELTEDDMRAMRDAYEGTPRRRR